MYLNLGFNINTKDDNGYNLVTTFLKCNENDDIFKFLIGKYGDKDDVNLDMKIYDSGKYKLYSEKRLKHYIQMIGIIDDPKIKSDYISGGSQITNVALIMYLLDKYNKNDEICPIVPTKYADVSDFKNITPISQNLFGFEWSCDITVGTHSLKTIIDFEKVYKNCLRNPSVRFIIIPMYLRHKTMDKCKNPSKYSDDHSNFILVDKVQKTIERFEPHGSRYYEWDMNNKHYESDKLDDELQLILKDKNKLTNDYRYLRPPDFCPIYSFQSIETTGKGFCTTWSFYYADLRLQFPNLPPKTLLDIATNTLNRDNINSFIYSYSSYLNTFIKKYSKQSLQLAKRYGYKYLKYKKESTELIYEMFIILIHMKLNDEDNKDEDEDENDDEDDEDEDEDEGEDNPFELVKSPIYYESEEESEEYS